MNIDKLKKVIQEANPEIMKTNNKLDYLWDTINEVGDGVLGKLEIEKSKLAIKFLNRPIRLADVLLALDKVDEKVFWVKNTEWGGEFIYFDLKVDGEVESHCYWNLKDNNLDNQSDECKEFLIKLLVKDNE